MEPAEEFFDSIKELEQTENGDPSGWDFYAAFMEGLFEKWKEVIGIHNKRRNI